MSSTEPRELAEVWTGFADLACGRYSPIYDRVSRAVAASDEVIDFILEAPPQAHMPTVLLACVHFLLLDGRRHPLVEVYEGTSVADPGPLFLQFCLDNRGSLLELMAYRHTNTNEVGRSAVLGPALVAAAERLGRPDGPLALVDVGCSAGLNLLCDGYLLEYPGLGTTGPADSEVRIRCDVTGGAPPVRPSLPSISSRVGIDLDPVDLGDPDEFRWQLACVWPDTGRLPRSRRALELARAAKPHIVQGDAVETVGRVLADLPDDVAPVVLTTWALAYLSREARVAFVDALAQASAAMGRPVAWVSGEADGVVPPLSGIEAPTDDHGVEASLLGLVVFDASGEAACAQADLLAFIHPHGTWIDWRAPVPSASVA